MMALPEKDGSVIGIITQVDLPNMVSASSNDRFLFYSSKLIQCGFICVSVTSNCLCKCIFITVQLCIISYSKA